MSAIRPIADLQFGSANTGTGAIQAPEPGPGIMRYELTDFEWTAIRPFVAESYFTAPAVSPATICLWANMVSRSTGSVTSSAAAASGPHDS
jgi:hypothetical protein